MFGSIYNGKTGLLAFSKGLDVLSNNIANLNTPGFKSAELAFRDLFLKYTTIGGNSEETSTQMGSGVDTPATTLRFREGEFRETGNALDAAVDGNGFFVLKKDSSYVYTRAGQLEFDADGFLVERTSRLHVMGLQGASLVDITLNGQRSSPPVATSEVVFIGNLSSGGTTHVIRDIGVYDALGVSHQLTVNFARNTAAGAPSGSWLLEVRDQGATDPTAVIASGEIRFQGNGSPATGFNTLSFSYAPAGGAPASTIVLNFGDPGTFSGTTSFSGGTTSDARVASQNGYAAGSLTKTEFDAAGHLRFSYSNGQTVTGERLALAWFEDLQKLTLGGGGIFESNGTERPTIAAPTEAAMGKIVPGKIELSNVDLTEQFTDMVIIQRGYQASSQVTSVANEMIQQLLEINRRG